MKLIQKYFTEFSEKQLQQFSALKDLYTEWNQKINVISRKDMENFYERHVLHSLAIATVFNFKAGARAMDLGSGGGFPGIPLAIFFPETEFHLVDSINKKLNVARAICESIGLQNVTSRHSRAEDIRDQKFDTIITRAVAPLKDLNRWSRPLLGKNADNKTYGLICLKGGDLSQEISESGTRPRIWEITQFFEEEFFKEKFLLFIPAIS